MIGGLLLCDHTVSLCFRSAMRFHPQAINKLKSWKKNAEHAAIKSGFPMSLILSLDGLQLYRLDCSWWWVTLRRTCSRWRSGLCASNLNKPRLQSRARASSCGPRWRSWSLSDCWMTSSLRIYIEDWQSSNVPREPASGDTKC